MRLPQGARRMMQTSRRTGGGGRGHFGKQRLVLSDQLQHQHLDQRRTFKDKEGRRPLARRMFGPNTVAKFCPLILLLPEVPCLTSPTKEERTIPTRTTTLSSGLTAGRTFRL
ncbi:hypothetical protein EYF80_049185 [Liparis tanakae]|uniref:Uncharacterized protein n=1 Tax=Liparis tanakae TaxID=230148 RepID=A0A4Z2FHF0_9TELE|nr:hypothetical protein EYF80_049185 [Liparis tanakae]